MNIRYATEEDQDFINKLCQLSYTKQDQRIGYPRVRDLNELLAELKEYENTIEKSILIIEKGTKMVGFTGFLFEPGDDEAFVVGPVFVEPEHNKENVTNLLRVLMKSSGFNNLYITVPSENTVTNQALRLENWKITHEQYEMKYELNQFNYAAPQRDIHPLTSRDALNFSKAAKLFEDVLEWKNADKLLKHDLEDFGMEAAYIENKGNLLGAVLWDNIENTDFTRLEDIAVHPEGRRQGIASELIHYVLNKCVETSKSTVFLAVDVDNQNAKNLYRKLNFETTMLNRTYGITVNNGSRQ